MLYSRTLLVHQLKHSSVYMLTPDSIAHFLLREYLYLDFRILAERIQRTASFCRLDNLFKVVGEASVGPSKVALSQQECRNVCYTKVGNFSHPILLTVHEVGRNGKHIEEKRV